MSELLARRPIPARPETAPRTYPPGWWGMAVAIATEAMLFAGLLSSYFFVRAISPAWPQGGIEGPHLDRTIAFTVVLLGSTVPMVIAERAARAGKMRRLRRALAATTLLGVAFVVNQGFEFAELSFRPGDNAYASLFIAITGLHGAHVVAGLLMLGVCQVKVWTGRVTAARHEIVRLVAMYWHFVDVVWVAVFTSLYVSVA